MTPFTLKQKWNKELAKIKKLLEYKIEWNTVQQQQNKTKQKDKCEIINKLNSVKI